jgi:hypothetical protein
MAYIALSNNVVTGYNVMHTQSPIGIYPHICIHIRTCTHMHTCTYTYTCINTHAQTHTHFIVDCGAPLSTRDDTITAVYNSTLQGSLLELSCRDAITAVCSPDGMWIPDPNMHTCKSLTSDSDSSGRSTI